MTVTSPSLNIESVPELKRGASFMVAWQAQKKRILIFGAGNVALSRVKRSIEADAVVIVVSPQANDYIQAYAARGDLTWIQREYKDSDIEEFAPDMVLAAITNHKVSIEIANICKAKRIPVNIADVPHLCDFYFMSEHRDGPLQIGVSTNGCGPALSMRIRKHVQANLPKDCGTAIEKVGNLRNKLRSADGNVSHSYKRMPWMSYICKNWPIEHLAQLSNEQMERLVTNYQSDSSYLPDTKDFSARGGKGKIVMVGAGLGHPDLLTRKAYRVLTEEAEFVISDRLISDEILSLVKCELRVARKVPGSASSAQDEINEWGLQAIREGKFVVRLKSGDPFLYGRAGEEILWYRKHGYEPSVVPGLSSALSPSLAGVPITHRGIANQVLILSAHNLNGAYPDIPEYHKERTLVLLMGVGRLPTIVNMLLQSNYPSSLPVSIIEKASHIDERKFFGNLSNIAELAKKEKVSSPAVIAFGHVVHFLHNK